MSVLNPYGLLFSGLFALIAVCLGEESFWFQITDREISRKQEVERKLEYISRKLGQIAIIKRLPDAGVESDQLINTAIDVVSAIFVYLAVHIRHEAALLGMIGNWPLIYWVHFRENWKNVRIRRWRLQICRHWVGEVSQRVPLGSHALRATRGLPNSSWSQKYCL